MKKLLFPLLLLAHMATAEEVNIIPKPASVRFVKVAVNNTQTVPAGKRLAGEKTWLYLDEIQVN